MGVKYLNSYLMRHCKRGIYPILLSTLTNKVVVVDTSIYLYKYKAIDKLIPNMARLIELFQVNSITPIFIFDGKPKSNKKKALQQRQEQKNVAWKKYSSMTTSASVDVLQKLKNQFIRVSQLDTEEVKQLMFTMNVQFIQAPHEADELCARFMLTKQADACISDDMDMLVHGCSHVIRDINLESQTANMYDLEGIVYSLGLNYDTFKQICVVSGTDYYNTVLNINDYFQLYKKFVDSGEEHFYEWLMKENIIDTKEELLLSYDEFNVLDSKFNYLDSLIQPV
jgi:5'-3' exonuclease